MATDPEVAAIKAAVSCALVLERTTPPWTFDRKESTRNALKYRRGPGEIVIVNHGGSGWWDATGEAKGDVFSLLQWLEPGLSFGHVRARLRALVGLQPAYPAYLRRTSTTRKTPADRWSRARPLTPGTPAWRYLEKERALPAWLLTFAAQADLIRAGSYGTPWFAHHDEQGRLTGFEMRGPGFQGFCEGGDKTLFRLPGSDSWHRLAVAEGAIDALSQAACEGLRSDTVYLATTGGLGPHTVVCLQALLAIPGRQLAIASDNDAPGDAMAVRLTALAEGAGCAVEPARSPLGSKDWNEHLQELMRTPSHECR